MAHCLHHAQSSARKFGGDPSDYQDLHNWFDESKAHIATMQHRALRHHTEGIFMLERTFGVSITNSNGKQVPTRFIGEQHVQEDLGFIPSIKDWFVHLHVQPWMKKGGALEFPEPVVNKVA
jgi:hypothetical protein